MVRQVTSTRAPPSGTKRSFLMPYKNGKSADFFKTPARLEFQRGVRPISAVLEARRGLGPPQLGSESAPPPAAGGESSANPPAPLPAGRPLTFVPRRPTMIQVLTGERDRGMAICRFVLHVGTGGQSEGHSGEDQR